MSDEGRRRRERNWRREHELARKWDKRHAPPELKSRITTPLTDDELLVIASADPSESTASIARRLGRGESGYRTVAHARRKIADGWSCPLRVSTCAACGRPLLASATQRPRRKTHVRCERDHDRAYLRSYLPAWRERNPIAHEAMREREKVKQREQWPDLPTADQAVALDRAHVSDQRDAALTIEHATNSGAPWTDTEDAYIIDRIDTPARQVALSFGRSLWSVRSRRVYLRKQGMLDSRSRAGGRPRVRQDAS